MTELDYTLAGPSLDPGALRRAREARSRAMLGALSSAMRLARPAGSRARRPEPRAAGAV
jgi:hypothetical protein